MHRGSSGAAYTTITFAELDAQATRLARGLATWGVPPATRLALLVRPGIEFVALVFALLRAGMVTILVDPGLGRRNLVRCLADAEPEGFIAISVAQAARTVLRRRFPQARWNVTVGRRWFWGGITLNQLADVGATGSASAFPAQAQAEPIAQAAHQLAPSLHAPCSMLPATSPDAPAAIIFTSGSTGPPKGVLYTHRMFDTQVSEIQSMYNIEPGGVDLACFPLFALFNSAMGVTTVLPEMDFSRPAKANPNKLLTAANDWQVTQAFASPAVWRVVGDFCAKTGDGIPSLRQVFSCGAPVGADVLRKTLACVAPGAKIHTPYGATECLPVSTIEASEVLGETADETNRGAGVCVGRKFDSIDWRAIRISEDPIASIDEAEELPPGEIGELIVRGPQASPCYVTRAEANAYSKIADCELRIADSNTQSEIRNPKSEIATWHRMGDVGYFDEQGRFWYCGRKSQRVETRQGTIFTECIEGVINSHPVIPRSALVGVGPRGDQEPVVIFEATKFLSRQDWLDQFLDLAIHCQRPWPICHYFNVNWRLPVDVRHNAKINREYLAKWAAKEIAKVQRKKQRSAGRPTAQPSARG
jgi:acyl-CoA synthetase (AMP-forming)/AMP-acid ligase II